MEQQALTKSKWLGFQAKVNSNHGLEWEFTKRLISASFLDLSIAIITVGKIKTTLLEKPMALYLFIQLYSAHPPGVLTGHIYGNILRIFCLNSDEDVIIEDTVTFYCHFLQCGHNSDVLTSPFLKQL